MAERFAFSFRPPSSAKTLATDDGEEIEVFRPIDLPTFAEQYDFQDHYRAFLGAIVGVEKEPRKWGDNVLSATDGIVRALAPSLRDRVPGAMTESQRLALFNAVWEVANEDPLARAVVIEVTIARMRKTQSEAATTSTESSPSSSPSVDTDPETSSTECPSDTPSP